MKQSSLLSGLRGNPNAAAMSRGLGMQASAGLGMQRSQGSQQRAMQAQQQQSQLRQQQNQTGMSRAQQDSQTRTQEAGMASRLGNMRMQNAFNYGQMRKQDNMRMRQEALNYLARDI